MWHGHKVDIGGWCLTTNTWAINLRASFLVVKPSTLNLMNIWVLPSNRALNDDDVWYIFWILGPSPISMHLVSTSCSPHVHFVFTSCPLCVYLMSLPDVIHMTNVPRLVHVKLNTRLKNAKSWGGLGTKLLTHCILDACSISWSLSGPCYFPSCQLGTQPC